MENSFDIFDQMRERRVGREVTKILTKLFFHWKALPTWSKVIIWSHLIFLSPFLLEMFIILLCAIPLIPILFVLGFIEFRVPGLWILVALVFSIGSFVDTGMDIVFLVRGLQVFVRRTLPVLILECAPTGKRNLEWTRRIVPSLAINSYHHWWNTQFTSHLLLCQSITEDNRLYGNETRT